MGASLTAAVDSTSVSSQVTLDWNATNYFVNPHFRIGTSTVNMRDNTFINPNVGTNTSAWGAVVSSSGTATLSRQTGSGLAAPLPDAFARMTWDTISTGALGSTGLVMGSATLDQLMCQSAYTLTFSVYARSSHADRTSALVVTWHDAAGATLGTTLTGTTTAIGGSSWVRLSVTGTSPANTVRAVVRVYSQGGTIWAVGDTLDATGVLTEYGSLVNSYFDGATALAQTEIDEGYTRGWNGTVNGSTSWTRLPAVASSGPVSQYQTNNNVYGRVFTEGEYRARAVIRNTLAANAIFGLTQTGTGNPASVPGETWAGRFQIRQINASAAITMYARLNTYNVGSIVQNGPVSPTVTVPADGSWVDCLLPAHTLAATGTNVRVLLQTLGSLPAGTTFELRRFVVEKSATVPASYYDGNTAGYQWSGTPDASTSVIIPATAATIVRINSEDGTISAVRNADPATLVGGLWIGNDYEVPLDAPFTYRATAATSPGFELLSPMFTVPADGRTMLKHPGRPALNITVRVEAGPNLSRPATQAVFDVLGRSAPLAVSMRRNSARGDLSLITYDEAERNALLLLLDDGTPLLLQTPDGYGLGNVYISVAEVGEERISPLGFEMARRWSLPFIVVDRPAGAALAVGNSWADVLAAYPSWQAMQAAEGTWTGVLEGVGS